MELQDGFIVGIFNYCDGLIWLGEAVEHVFPHARPFVRPGFDEPDAVARLEVE